MSIIQIQTDTVGQVNVNPRSVRIVCNDTYQTITSAGYLSGSVLQGMTIYPTDQILISYGISSPSAPIFGIFVPSFGDNGLITLLDTGSNQILAKITSPAFSGGSNFNTFIANGLTSSSIVTASIKTQTNNVSITKVVPGTNILTITFSADPGTGTTVSYISVNQAI